MALFQTPLPKLSASSSLFDCSSKQTPPTRPTYKPTSCTSVDPATAVQVERTQSQDASVRLEARLEDGVVLTSQPVLEAAVVAKRDVHRHQTSPIQDSLPAPRRILAQPPLRRDVAEHQDVEFSHSQRASRASTNDLVETTTTPMPLKASRESGHASAATGGIVGTVSKPGHATHTPASTQAAHATVSSSQRLKELREARTVAGNVARDEQSTFPTHKTATTKSNPKEPLHTQAKKQDSRPPHGTFKPPKGLPTLPSRMMEAEPRTTVLSDETYKHGNAIATASKKSLVAKPIKDAVEIRRPHAAPSASIDKVAAYSKDKSYPKPCEEVGSTAQEAMSGTDEKRGSLPSLKKRAAEIGKDQHTKIASKVAAECSGKDVFEVPMDPSGASGQAPKRPVGRPRKPATTTGSAKPGKARARKGPRTSSVAKPQAASKRGRKGGGGKKGRLVDSSDDGNDDDDDDYHHVSEHKIKPAPRASGRHTRGSLNAAPLLELSQDTRKAPKKQSDRVLKNALTIAEVSTWHEATQHSASVQQDENGRETLDQFVASITNIPDDDNIEAGVHAAQKSGQDLPSTRDEDELNRTFSTQHREVKSNGTQADSVDLCDSEKASDDHTSVESFGESRRVEAQDVEPQSPRRTTRPGTPARFRSSPPVTSYTAGPPGMTDDLRKAERTSAIHKPRIIGFSRDGPQNQGVRTIEKIAAPEIPVQDHTDFGLGTAAYVPEDEPRDIEKPADVSAGEALVAMLRSSKRKSRLGDRAGISVYEELDVANQPLDESHEVYPALRNRVAPSILMPLPRTSSSPKRQLTAGTYTSTHCQGLDAHGLHQTMESGPLAECRQSNPGAEASADIDVLPKPQQSDNARHPVTHQRRRAAQDSGAGHEIIVPLEHIDVAAAVTSGYSASKPDYRTKQYLGPSIVPVKDATIGRNPVPAESNNHSKRGAQERFDRLGGQSNRSEVNPDVGKSVSMQKQETISGNEGSGPAVPQLDKTTGRDQKSQTKPQAKLDCREIPASRAVPPSNSLAPSLAPAVSTTAVPTMRQHGNSSAAAAITKAQLVEHPLKKDQETVFMVTDHTDSRDRISVLAGMKWHSRANQSVSSKRKKLSSDQEPNAQKGLLTVETAPEQRSSQRRITEEGSPVRPEHEENYSQQQRCSEGVSRNEMMAAQNPTGYFPKAPIKTSQRRKIAKMEEDLKIHEDIGDRGDDATMLVIERCNNNMDVEEDSQAISHAGFPPESNDDIVNQQDPLKDPEQDPFVSIQTERSAVDERIARTERSFLSRLRSEIQHDQEDQLPESEEHQKVDDSTDEQDGDDPDKTLVDDDFTSDEDVEDDRSSEFSEMTHMAKWVKALEPHQRPVHDSILRLTHELLRHLVDAETAIVDIVEDYHLDCLWLLNSLETSYKDKLNLYVESAMDTQKDLARGFKLTVKHLDKDMREVRISQEAHKINVRGGEDALSVLDVLLQDLA